MVAAADFLSRGWARFPADHIVDAWLSHVTPHALATCNDPAHDRWWRHGRTWFAGVNVLDNDARGRVGKGPPLGGAAVDFIATALGLPHPDWDRAQVSVTRPGYPGQDADESDAAHRYRRDHDAAHVDGLIAEGPHKRRRIAEPHAFILGLPLTRAAPDAAPLVVWEGSHTVMRTAFQRALAPHPPSHWAQVDITAEYQAARREVFASCPRRVLPALPGEALLLHRLTLHGVAPWAGGAASAPEGRAIIYFRPVLSSVEAWLDRP